MKQITEDYCSFEVAKLLKEKGFDIPCRQAYFNGSLVDYTMYGFCDGELLDCPTHQMALKWLREVHKINIVIGVASDDDNIYSLWKFDIWNGNYSIIWGDKREKFNSYEEAVEAALKYTLENLI